MAWPIDDHRPRTPHPLSIQPNLRSPKLLLQVAELIIGLRHPRPSFRCSRLFDRVRFQPLPIGGQDHLLMFLGPNRPNSAANPTTLFLFFFFLLSAGAPPLPRYLQNPGCHDERCRRASSGGAGIPRGRGLALAGVAGVHIKK
jgi:hypothetical protein